MKQRSLLFLLLVVTLFSCNYKSNDISDDKETQDTISDNFKIELCIRPNLQLALDSFINEVPSLDEFNEIYIDKIGISEYETIIFTGKSSLSSGGKSPLHFTYKGITFYLYSGLEHYFDNCKNDTLFDDRINLSGGTIGYFWLVKENEDFINIEKNRWAIPYLTLYQEKQIKVKFKAPVIRENN